MRKTIGVIGLVTLCAEAVAGTQSPSPADLKPTGGRGLTESSEEGGAYRRRFQSVNLKVMLC